MKWFVNSVIVGSLLLASFGALAEEAPAPVAAAAPAVSLDDLIAKSLKEIVDKTVNIKGRVAIMDFPSLETGSVTGLSTYIANKAGNQMIKANRQVVDRAALERIISEQKLQQNTLMDAATASKVGKLAGAGVFVIGNYSVLARKVVLTIRALSVETGQFIAASEETVAMNDDLKSEVNELHGKAVQASKTADLSGGSSEPETITQEEYQKQLAQAEVKYDIELCKKIRTGMDITEVYGLAVKHGIVEMPDDFINTRQCKDTLGEDSQAGCVRLSSWNFDVNSYGIDASDIAKAYKGRRPSSTRIITQWAYEGPSNLPGLDQCAPNGGEWNDKRGGGKSGKKK